MSKKVMVIGANGMLGNEIMHHCIRQGWETECVYHKNAEYLDPHCKKRAVTSIESCDDSYDLVFLSAGNFSNGRQDLLSNNVWLPMFCTQRFKSAKLIFISSTNVYGTHHDVITETSTFNNPGPYGLSKIAGEFIIQSHRQYSIIRPSIILGSRINPDTFIGRTVRSAKQENKVLLFGSGARRQDYISVTDVAAISIRAALLQSNDCLLAVYGRSFSNAEIGNFVRTISGCEIVYKGADTAASSEFNCSYSNGIVNYQDRADIFESIKVIYEAL